MSAYQLAIVTHLDFIFDGWLGDDLGTSSLVHLVTDRLRTALESAGLSGFEFDHVDVITSEEFDQVFPEVDLPTWHGLPVTGSAPPRRRLVGKEGAADRLAAVHGRLGRNQPDDVHPDGDTAW